MPIIITNEPVRESAAILAKMNTKIGKDEWDSFEVSWDFKLHPLIHNIVEHKPSTILVVLEPDHAEAVAASPPVQIKAA